MRVNSFKEYLSDMEQESRFSKMSNESLKIKSYLRKVDKFLAENKSEEDVAEPDHDDHDHDHNHFNDLINKHKGHFNHANCQYSDLSDSVHEVQHKKDEICCKMERMICTQFKKINYEKTRVEKEEVRQKLQVQKRLDD